MRTTREGRRFLLATALIAVAAYNTGNNLIYLILSMMLSILLLSFTVPAVMLSRIAADIVFDRLVIAGAEAYASITVRNRKRCIPAFSVHIAAPFLPLPFSVPLIPAAGASERTGSVVFSRRGLCPDVVLTAESSFPFILFYARRTITLRKDLIVYPAWYDLQMQGPASSAAGEGSPHAGGTGDDILHIRAFRYGDDLRRVHWKASARLSELMVKEYAEQESCRMTIILDNASSTIPGDFEKAVSIAATLARDLIAGGNTVRVVTADAVVPFGSGDEHLLQILDMLALLQEDAGRKDLIIPDEEGAFIVVAKSEAACRGGQFAAPGRCIYADSV
ncbi:MAG: DUF58 domain-containing protein [Nitrospirae bacterium]|nr:MAG: DUF58 domain-containing protein [Nitrospirota bacterium]